MARSIVLIEDGQVYLRSSASLRIAKRLPWPWSMAGAFLVIPAPLRDAVYRVVAAIRHRLAGRSNACEVPPPEIRERMILTSAEMRRVAPPARPLRATRTSSEGPLVCVKRRAGRAAERHDAPRLRFPGYYAPMRRAVLAALSIVLVGLSGFSVMSQEQDPSRNTDPRFTTTMRPVVTGRSYAVSSMKPQATEAAARILEAGGNAFDAAVAGQAVLGTGRSRDERLRRRRRRAGLRREDEEGRLDQRRGHRAAARDDRLVQEEQRRQAFRRTTACSPRRCPASSTRGTCCSIAGAR